MLENGKIGSRQLLILVVMLTIGDAILVLPSIPAMEAKQDAWIVAIVSVILGSLIVFLYHSISILFPNLTLVEYSEKILGKWLGITVSFLFLSYWFISAAAHLGQIGSFLSTHIMPDTPVQWINGLFLCTIIMATRLGLEPVARSAEIFFPFLLLLLLILIFFLLPEIKTQNMKPILEEGFKPIIRGSFAFIAFPFMELIVILMILPYVSEKQKIRKSLFLGALIGGLVLIVITTLTILVLGADQTARHIYPSYALSRKINVGNFLQRVEAIMAILWFITIFFKIGLYFYATSLGLAQTLRLKEYRPFTIPLGMILIVLSLVVSPNIVYYNNAIIKYWPLYDMTMGFILPMLLLTVARFQITQKKEM